MIFCWAQLSIENIVGHIKRYFLERRRCFGSIRDKKEVEEDDGVRLLQTYQKAQVMILPCILWKMIIFVNYSSKRIFLYFCFQIPLYFWIWFYSIIIIFNLFSDISICRSRSGRKSCVDIFLSSAARAERFLRIWRRTHHKKFASIFLRFVWKFDVFKFCLPLLFKNLFSSVMCLLEFHCCVFFGKMLYHYILVHKHHNFIIFAISCRTRLRINSRIPGWLNQNCIRSFLWCLNRWKCQKNGKR